MAEDLVVGKIEFNSVPPVKADEVKVDKGILEALKKLTGKDFSVEEFPTSPSSPTAPVLEKKKRRKKELVESPKTAQEPSK